MSFWGINMAFKTDSRRRDDVVVTYIRFLNKLLLEDFTLYAIKLLTYKSKKWRPISGTSNSSYPEKRFEEKHPKTRFKPNFPS